MLFFLILSASAQTPLHDVDGYLGWSGAQRFLWGSSTEFYYDDVEPVFVDTADTSDTASGGPPCPPVLPSADRCRAVNLTTDRGTESWVVGVESSAGAEALCALGDLGSLVGKLAGLPSLKPGTDLPTAPTGLTTVMSVDGGYEAKRIREHWSVEYDQPAGRGPTATVDLAAGDMVFTTGHSRRTRGAELGERGWTELRTSWSPGTRSVALVWVEGSGLIDGVETIRHVETEVLSIRPLIRVAAHSSVPKALANNQVTQLRLQFGPTSQGGSTQARSTSAVFAKPAFMAEAARVAASLYDEAEVMPLNWRSPADIVVMLGNGQPAPVAP